MRKVRLLVVIFLSILASTSAAQEPQRFALVIGNQGYHPSVGVLKNPHNDIALVSAALQKQGFTVLPPLRDARRAQILGAVRQLVQRLNSARPGAVGFVYYSGHGAAEKDTNVNYLIPIDAHAPDQPEFWDESVKLDEILRLLDGARSAAKFVVFDACRNELQLAERTSDKGFIPVREYQGMFIGYATAPGRPASDRGATSGPYAEALAAELAKPGLDHLNLFQNVKEAVISSTGGSQQPWSSDGLARRVSLTAAAIEPPAKPPPLATLQAQQSSSEAALAWDRIKDTRSTTVLEAYARQFPETVYAALAAERVGDLQRGASIPQASRTVPSMKVVASPQMPPVGTDPSCFEARSDAPDVVIRACSAVIEANPAKPTLERALNRRGLALMRTNRFQEALADYDRLIASNRTNSGYYDNRQSVHRSLGQLQLAFRDATEAIRLSPDRAFGYHSRGNIYFDMGRFEDAISDYTRGLSTKDPFIFSIYDRGRAYAKLGQFDSAVRDFTAVIAKDAKVTWAYRERAFAYIGMKSFDKALADLQHFLQHEPNEPEALVALSRLRGGGQ